MTVNLGVNIFHYQGGSERAKQHEGTKEDQGKVSLEEAGQRGGQKIKRLIQLGKQHEKK